MKHSKPEIRVGARGWQFDDWAGEFYPDDLPQDWRFSFYSNEFKTVLVPYDYLARYSLEDWQEWVDDTEKDFSFFVEIPETAQWSQVEPYLLALGEHWQGAVVVVEALEDIEGLATLINKLKPLVPISLKRVGDKVTDKEMETLQACYEVNECWDGIRETPSWGCGGVAVLLRDVNENNRPEQIRQIIEKGLGYAGKCEAVVLFFTGTSPKISDINNTKMISELLV